MGHKIAVAVYCGAKTSRNSFKSGEKKKCFVGIVADYHFGVRIQGQTHIIYNEKVNWILKIYVSAISS